MAIKVPNVGELRLMAILRAQINGGGVTLRLYQNNYTPVDGSVLADFTECDFDGYAAKTLTAFTVPILVGGEAYIAEGPQIWTATGGVTPNDVYGYYVEDPVDGEVIWAARFTGAPIVVDGAGDVVVVTPTFTLASAS